MFEFNLFRIILENYRANRNKSGIGEKKVMRNITWNDQRNNKSHFENAKTFSAFNQCFSSDAVMLMSFYCDKIKGDDDLFLAKYLWDIEDSLNKNGLGAQVREQKHLDPNTKSSYFFAVQAAGITHYLNNYGIAGQALVKEFFPISDVPECVAERPTIIGTHYLGKLPDGHMILLVDYDPVTKSYKTNDSFGDARTNYKVTNGNGVMYGHDFLKPHVEINVNKYPGKCNILYFQPE